MYQAPAINGACMCCCIVGIKLADLATFYHGSHAFLAPDDPLRTWRGRLLEAFDGLARQAPGYEV